MGCCCCCCSCGCSKGVTDLTEEKKMKAEEARTAACELVQDALDKKLYGLPVSFFYTCSDPVDPHEFCCILTEKFLRDLLKTLNEISFKEDTKEKKTFAYVMPYEGTKIVYLCELFWTAPDSVLCLEERKSFCRLKKDSKPGTLLHEVSHLLGTEDFTYNNVTIELFENYGTLMGRSVGMRQIKAEIEEDLGVQRWEEAVQINANSLEYEFETIINHEEKYRDGKYPCCGESKRNSVCRSRSTGHYILHERFGNQSAEMKHKLEKYQTARDTTSNKMYVKRKNKFCDVILKEA